MHVQIHETSGINTKAIQKSILEKQVLWGLKQSPLKDCKFNALLSFMEFFMTYTYIYTQIYIDTLYYPLFYCTPMQLHTVLNMCKFIWLLQFYMWYFFNIMMILLFILVTRHNENKNSLCPKPHQWLRYMNDSILNKISLEKLQ